MEKKPHVHAALIKAWADGAEIQYSYRGDWIDTSTPNWNPTVEYRIKPEPKPDVVFERKVITLIDRYGDYFTTGSSITPNVRFVFDGETRKLKSVTMI